MKRGLISELEISLIFVSNLNDINLHQKSHWPLIRQNKIWNYKSVNNEIWKITEEDNEIPTMKNRAHKGTKY